LFAIEEVSATGYDDTTASASPARPAVRAQFRRRIAFAGAAGVLAGGAIVGAGVWYATRMDAPESPRVSRLVIASSGAGELAISGNYLDLAITPDGSRVIYVGNKGTQIFVRALDALEPIAVFTGTPRGVFGSPDGRWIGFTDDYYTLKKIPLTGGPAVAITDLTADALRGATWGPDDDIVFATGNLTTGLQRVNAAGGQITVLTRPDRAKGEDDHVWPELLPGGRAVLFTITRVAGGLDAAQVALLDLQTGTSRILVQGGSHARYVSSPRTGVSELAGGYLVYAAAGTLRAVAFDLARMQTRGGPVPVVPEVVTTLNGGANAVVARDGTLAYVAGGSVMGVNSPRTLVWVDRQGREMPIHAPPRPYVFPRLSPDGTRIAALANDQEVDLWLWDLGRTASTRATFDPARDTYPVWMPDGSRLIFSSDRAGARNLYWQATDGTGVVERLNESPNHQHASAVSPDGRWLIFTEISPDTNEDVMELQLDGAYRVTPLEQSTFNERNGVISPDSRWIAYEANESGQYEIVVRPFPEVSGGRWQVTTTGGTRPFWAPNGQELFYVSPTGALMRIRVERGTSWAAASPTVQVKEGYYTSPVAYPGRSYDISRDGQRFLLIKERNGSDGAASSTSIIVVQHWVEELKRLVPVN
jgi:serine/threonine-protein kinase